MGTTFCAGSTQAFWQSESYLWSGTHLFFYFFYFSGWLYFIEIEIDQWIYELHYFFFQYQDKLKSLFKPRGKKKLFVNIYCSKFIYKLELQYLFYFLNVWMCLENSFEQKRFYVWFTKTIYGSFGRDLILNVIILYRHEKSSYL